MTFKNESMGAMTCSNLWHHVMTKVTEWRQSGNKGTIMTPVLLHSLPLNTLLMVSPHPVTSELSKWGKMVTTGMLYNT